MIKFPNRLGAKLCGSMLALMISACAYPASSVTQGGKVTALYFDHAPVGAQVFVDGVDAGSAELFDGLEATLAVTPGRHVVELRIGGSEVFRKDLFLGDGAVLKVDVSQVGIR